MAQRKKRKRRVEAGSKKKAGVMIGMRSGFKKAASAVTGSEPAVEKKKSWVSTAITIALVLAAAAILYYRNR
ncbi:MAG TPA: hypothetical protein VMZ28_25030 [Kofleriaceae bacterium]|nr:hypothetical protein [Kofleriaceae bacterium]